MLLRFFCIFKRIIYRLTLCILCIFASADYDRLRSNKASGIFSKNYNNKNKNNNNNNSDWRPFRVQ